MKQKKITNQNMKLNVDVSELTPQQVRLIKSINMMLTHVLATDDEGEYFDGSAELMKLVATAVKQANFTTVWCENNQIPYSTQALEFCLDFLNDEIYTDKLVRYDN